MKIIDMITLTVGNLWRRKVRTLLTVMGVVVGTCSIVVMISLGVGMDASLQQRLSQMGDLTIIDVYNYGNKPDKKELDDKAIKEISQMEKVVVASPFWSPWDMNMTFVNEKNGRYECRGDVVGVYPEALKEFGYELFEGDFLPSAHDKKKVTIVVGEDMSYQFRDTKRKNGGYIWKEPLPDGSFKKPYVDVTKEKINLVMKPQDEDKHKDLKYEVVVKGRLKTDYNKDYRTAYGCFMDINQLKQLQKEYNKENGIKVDSKTQNSYESVKVKVQSMEDVEAVEKQIQDMGFETSSMEQIRKPMEEQTRQQQIMFGGLGAISLFVAAIGITNTMVMSIYERTREIGVMKVLGCKLSNIRTIFLMESGLIGFLGGIVGTLASYGISNLLNKYGGAMSGSMDMMGGMMMGMGGDPEALPISIIPPWLVILAIVFATIIGLVSGFYPANRAVKISAMEAIKHD
ncbi:MAG: FtsX-like permease family protein [Oscillospiraceae bacterium]